MQTIEKTKSRKRKRSVKMMIGILAFLLVIFIVGAIYQAASLRADQQKYPPVGKMIEVNGHRMHMYGEGEGEITVVLGSGFGTPSPYVDFYPLYSKLSKHTRVVVYERPGYGWSETTKDNRDVDIITEEIHTLLEKTGEKPPYLLVGHSLASLESIRFAQMYEDEVAGIVMLDGGSPEFYQSDKSSPALPLYGIQMLKHTGVLRTLMHVDGVANLLTKPQEGYGELTPEKLKELNAVMVNKNTYNRNLIQESNNVTKNAQTVIDGGRLQNIPLTLFTSGNNNQEKKWSQTQKDFTKWSNKSKQIVIEGAGHYVHHDDPDLIVKEIINLIEKK